MSKKKKTLEEKKKELTGAIGKNIKGFGGKPLIDPEHVKNMRENAGEIAKEREGNQYMEPVGVTPRQRIVAFMSACGALQKDIAVATGFSNTHISQLLRRPHVIKEIEKIQYRIFSSHPKKAFDEIMPSAIQTALKVMLDPGQKGGIRLNAAQDFMDRAAGKALQRIEKEETQLISILIGKLQHSLPKAVESLGKAEDNEQSQAEQQVIDVTPVEEENPMDVSSWVDENV